MIQTPVILEGYRSLKDGSLKLTFETQDVTLNEGDITQLLGSVGQYGMLGFKVGENRIQEGEISDIQPVLSLPNPKQVSKDKSPSKELRSALYVYYEKTGIEGDFDTFYERSMETFRQRVLSQIPED